MNRGLLRFVHPALLLAATILFAAAPASAQFGRLKDKLRDTENRVKETEKKNTGTGEAGPTSSPAPASATQPGSPEVNRPARRPNHIAPNGGSKLLFDESNPPAPLYSTLLSEGVRMYDDGGLHLESFLIANLPEKVEGSDATVAYGPYDNQQRLTAAVKDAAGKTLGEFALAATRRNDGTWAASSTQDVKADGRQYVSRVNLVEGRYVLDFYAGGRHFYSFPFGVRRLSSGAKNIYGTTGPWDDYGMFDTKGGTHWNVWMRKDDPNPNARDVDIKVKVEVTRNGKVVAVNHQDFTEFALHRRDWKPYRIPLAAATPGSMSISPAALFNGDGNYEVVVTVNGAKQVYPFQVKDGRFVSQGRQAREGTDPLRVIEDARGVYFVRRKGATYD